MELVDEAIAALRAANDALAALPAERLTQAQTTAVLDEMQVLRCQLPSHDHRLLAHLQAETTAKEMGAKSWSQVLATRWRITTSEAGRRLADAALLGPRRSLTGEEMAPVLPATAAAMAHGAINAEHVKVIREAVDRIPASVDPRTRAQMEIDWARAAVGVGPKKLKDDANRTLFLLDQDGPEPDDHERQRRRGITKSPQQPDGMIALKAVLTPEAWAIVEAIFAKWAAPGMCNPADEHPCTAGTPTQEQITRDDRTLSQRQHDALMQVGRWVLQSGVLGKQHGVAATIVIRTTLQDLESRAGVGVTGGGTMLPIRDVLKMAASANLYLAVFDGATGSAMDLFRARRTATIAQWLMLIARDGGCTKPGCPVPAYGTQVHHAVRDWADDGQTNVDDMCLACGPDNRSVGPGGWTTRMNEHHDVEWIPPPQLDTNQTRINDYHRPERLYRPPDDEPAPAAPPPDAPAEPQAEPESAPWDPLTAWDQATPQHDPQSMACDEPAPDGNPETDVAPSIDGNPPTSQDKPEPRDEPEMDDDDHPRAAEPNVFTLCARHHPAPSPEPGGPQTPGGPEPNVA